MMKSPVLMPLAILLFAGVGAVWAQTTPQKPPAQTPPPVTAASAPKTQAPAPAAPPKTQAPAPAPSPVAGRASITIMVTDLSGKGVADVHTTVTGPVSREGATGRDGGLAFQALRAGNYRLRFDSPEVITLERDVTIKAGAPVEVDVALDRVPAKPATTQPAPPPSTTTRAGATAPPDANATIDLLSLPDWVEANLIGRNDPQKETIVGRTAAATARVIQVRDPIKDHVRGDADEMLYVIAGQGVLRAKGRDQSLDAGSLAVIPRGVAYSLERRGRNPLIALSIVGK